MSNKMRLLYANLLSDRIWLYDRLGRVSDYSDWYPLEPHRKYEFIEAWIESVLNE